MVKKRQTKRQRDIKTKLMAAICMLLVSSIMMVSTTYAWFTLSTAPEVTGITTAVGANGNLEMALLPLDGDTAKITANQGDSMAAKAAYLSNTTWGNLVDVSDNAHYGLDKIVLYPAKLNTKEINVDGQTVDQIQANPLSTPVYGADGRVSELSGNTIYGTMDPERASFYEGNELVPGYGVRAIGTASGMTPRNLAWRQAMSDASVYAGQAKSVASSTLNANGSILADVAVNHALYEGEDGTDTYTAAQVDALSRVVNSLLGNGTTDNPGSLGNIELALKNYIVAYTIAEAAYEDTFATTRDAILAASLQDLIDGKVAGAKIPAGYADDTTTADVANDGYVAKLNVAVSNATAAKTVLDNLPTKDTYTWAEIKDAMHPLVSTSGLLINGTTVSDVMANPGALAGSILKNGLILTMGSGAGVFADIADFAGNYSAGIIISKLQYGTTVVQDVEATMNTDTDVDPVYLTQAATTVSEKEYEIVGGGAGADPLTDFYGYVIDLAFRTNATDSYLQIQQEGIDRIYGEEGSNIHTQGNGATMSFTSPSTTFNAVAMQKLMQAVRIVFFDTTTGHIVSYARLDATNPEPYQDGGFTMPIYLCSADGTAKADDESTADVDESIAIMALEQNTIHQLSVLVYLDGEKVDNAAVAADAAKSLVGTMNLQFSSSATLDAMDYSDLMSGEGGALDGANAGGEEEEDEPIILTAVDSEAYTIVAGAYDGTNVAIQLNGATAGDAVVVTIGGNAYETTVLEQDGKQVVVVAASDVVAGTAITVEPKA